MKQMTSNRHSNNIRHEYVNHEAQTQEQSISWRITTPAPDTDSCPHVWLKSGHSVCCTTRTDLSKLVRHIPVYAGAIFRTQECGRCTGSGTAGSFKRQESPRFGQGSQSFWYMLHERLSHVSQTHEPRSQRWSRWCTRESGDWNHISQTEWGAATQQFSPLCTGICFWSDNWWRH